MEELSMKIFGTPDYAAVLEILPPYDGAVRQFLEEAERLGEPAHAPGQPPV